jgi:hypothetical protein
VSARGGLEFAGVGVEGLDGDFVACDTMSLAVSE